MQLDFHYYATYCAACLAGYQPEEAARIAYCAQLTDCCTRTFLRIIKGPLSAATTQSQTELMDARTDLLGLQDITRIWASFHFLPRDLYADPPGKSSKGYRDKYRLMCGPDSALLVDTVELVRGKSLEAVGLAMHVLADTWAHRYFAGTASLVMNNTNYYFYEMLPEGAPRMERAVRFKHNPGMEDDLDNGIYVNTVYQMNESSIMNLGHGRAGHLPDYCFMRYRYLPAWGAYEEIWKDNPTDYFHAFCQMIYAMKSLRDENGKFQVEIYDTKAAAEWEDRIDTILHKRQKDASADWKALGEAISGTSPEEFDETKFMEEYRDAAEEDKDSTVLGRFILAALAQKSMVTNRIFLSGNLQAGFSVNFKEKGLQGIRDFWKLAESFRLGK